MFDGQLTPNPTRRFGARTSIEAKILVVGAGRAGKVDGTKQLRGLVPGFGFFRDLFVKIVL